MKIYISGKITGDRRYKAKFREVEKKLAAAGHIVLNPATAPEGLRPDITFVKATRLEVMGEKKLEALRAGSVTLPCEGVFILRPSMAPAALLPGLALEGGYIKTDRNMATNLPGVFAAVDGQVAGHRA